MKNFTGGTSPQIWLFNNAEDVSTANSSLARDDEDKVHGKDPRYDFLDEQGKHQADLPHAPPLEPSRTLHALTPWIVPSWQLNAGCHIQVEASLGKRQFITSSFMRDTVRIFTCELRE